MKNCLFSDEITYFNQVYDDELTLLRQIEETLSQTRGKRLKLSNVDKRVVSTLHIFTRYYRIFTCSIKEKMDLKERYERIKKGIASTFIYVIFVHKQSLTPI